MFRLINRDVLTMDAIFFILLMDKVHTSVVLLYATFRSILQLLSERMFSTRVEGPPTLG